MAPPPFLIGVDLGTTNSAVAAVDTQRRNPRVEVFRIPQLTAPGVVEPRGHADWVAHQRTNWPNADSNPAACASSSCRPGSSGLTAPSSTKARTRDGNCCA